MHRFKKKKKRTVSFCTQKQYDAAQILKNIKPNLENKSKNNYTGLKFRLV